MRGNTFFLYRLQEATTIASSTIAAERWLQFDRLDPSGGHHEICWLRRIGDEGSGTTSSRGMAGSGADAQRTWVRQRQGSSSNMSMGRRHRRSKGRRGWGIVAEE